MRMRAAWGSGVAAVAAFLLSPPARAGVEKDVELGAVPKAVLSVAERVLEDPRILAGDTQTGEDDEGSARALEQLRSKLAGARLVGANTETETDGSYVYEIRAVLADGRRIEIDVFPEGRIEEIEVEYRREDVPGAVLGAIQAKLPGFAPTFIEASHSGALKVLAYELEGTLNGAPMDLEVSADGRRIEVADR